MRNEPLDLVLPCFNPLEGWEQVVLDAIEGLEANLPGVQIHLILVNDGSTKGVHPGQIERLKNTLPSFLYLENPENKGKGYTLRRGIGESQHPICIFTDIDFPYTLESLAAIYHRLATQEVDIAVGIKDAGYYQHLSPFRVFVSKGLRFLARTFLRISITDTQCGLKGFNAQGRKIFLETTIDRYLCDLEFIYLADRNSKIRMEPLPVQLKEGVEFSTVNLRILFWEGLNFLKIWWKARFNRDS